MVFANLFKPPHLKRFLLALVAGGVALFIYFSAEHFKVVPGTAALEEEMPETPSLGESSLLVVPVAGDCPEDLPAVIALEMIRLLVREPAVEVIAAASSLARYGQGPAEQRDASAPQTAWQLHIRCSQQPNTRITTSLLATQDMAENWVIEREYDESELPELIQQLWVRLSEHFQIQSAPSRNFFEYAGAAEYFDYLKARWLLHMGGEHAEAARILLNNVIETRPDWAAALSARGFSYLIQPEMNAESAAENISRSMADFERAEALNQGDPEAHLYQSIVAHRFAWDWDAAYEQAKRAVELAPGDAGILAAASTAAFTLGKFAEGEQWLHKAIPLDPLVLSHWLKYGLILDFKGQHRAAIEAYRELKILDPYYPSVHAYLGRALIVGDRIKLALPHMELERNAFWRKYGVALALYAMERKQEADEAMAQFIRQYENEAAIQIAEIKAYSGQTEEAFQWLERAIEQRDPGVSALIGNPLFETLTQDPRWPETLKSLGLPEFVGENPD